MVISLSPSSMGFWLSSTNQHWWPPEGRKRITNRMVTEGQRKDVAVTSEPRCDRRSQEGNGGLNPDHVAVSFISWFLTATSFTFLWPSVIYWSPTPHQYKTNSLEWNGWLIKDSPFHWWPSVTENWFDLRSSTGEAVGWQWATIGYPFLSFT